MIKIYEWTDEQHQFVQRTQGDLRLYTKEKLKELSKLSEMASKSDFGVYNPSQKRFEYFLREE